MLLCTCILFYTTMSECMIFLYGPTVPEINYSSSSSSFSRKLVCSSQQGGRSDIPLPSCITDEVILQCVSVRNWTVMQR